MPWLCTASISSKWSRRTRSDEERARAWPHLALVGEHLEELVDDFLVVQAQRLVRHDDQVDGRHRVRRARGPRRRGWEREEEPLAAAGGGVDDEVGAGGHRGEGARLHRAEWEWR
jgi:hypothetical protein